MDDHSLTLLEFNRVTASVAEHAASERARSRLLAWRPIADRSERSNECRDVAEAIRRMAESGEWCDVGEHDIRAMLGEEREQLLDGEALVAVRSWLDAASRARAYWKDEE